jgi:YD repeat-containing protein
MKRLVVIMVLAFSTCLLAGVAHADLSSGLVAHYKLDGNGKDEVGPERNNLTIYNAVDTTDRICYEEAAMEFDGVDDSMYAWSPTSHLNIGTQDWSISAWFKTSTAHAGALVSRYECGWYCSFAAALYILKVNENGVVGFWIRDDYGYYWGAGSNEDYDDGKWHNVVGVLDRTAAEMRFYYDGYLVSTTDATGIVQVDDAGSPLTIGERYLTGWGSPDTRFEGSIDNVRIYNRALEACEIAELNFMDPDL